MPNNPTRRTASETKALIFESCGRILCTGGMTKLTLDAVALEAGLSKGGLLYHFPTKLALIEALFEYHNDIFEQRLQELATAEADQPGAWLRAYAKASIEQITDTGTARIYRSLFAAEDQYDSAHQLMRQKYDRWQTLVQQSGLAPDLALMIRLTVDGLWFAEMHQYAAPSPVEREKIFNRIINLTNAIEE